MSSKNIKGRYYLIFGIIVFVIFVLIDNITNISLSAIFGDVFIEWDYWVQVLSRIIPTTLWVSLFLLAKKICITKLNFSFTQNNEKVPLKNYLIVTFFVVISILFNYLSWGNFKLLIEYQNAGLVGFLAQHIYYFAEITIVATLIVLFQKSCETWFKKPYIPYSGIIVAVTWGLAHIFTQDSVAVGLLAFLYGIGFGSVYLVLKRNFKLTVLFLFLMFAF